jgi:hypothetical protein
MSADEQETPAVVEVPATLAGSLALVQSQLPRIVKDRTAEVPTKTGGMYSYSYADLAAVSAEILPLLGRCGLAWVTRPTTVEGRFVLTYHLLHVSGEVIDGEFPLPPPSTPQAMGSAITYARRYTLCAVTGVAADTDDDDAAHATNQARGRQTVSRPQRQSERPQDRGQTRPVQRRQRPPDDDGPPPLPGEEPPDGITPPQLGKLGVLFTAAGVKGDGARAERLRIASEFVGRELSTSKDLTRSEASRLIDHLERETAPADDSPPLPGEDS